MSELGPRLTHRHLITVAEADLDELEHVNNAVYLRYIEDVARAHSERFGLTLDAFRALGVVPVVRRHLVTYHRPARLGDRLEVSTTVTKMGGIRAERHNEVRHAESGTLLVEAVTEWVWLHPTSGRPKPVPSELLETFGWNGP